MKKDSSLGKAYTDVDAMVFFEKYLGLG